MKIMIIGSMQFAKKMLNIENSLIALGYTVLVPEDVDEFSVNNNLKNKFENNFNSELEHCLSKDLMNKELNKIAKSDAVLVVNLEKKGIKGYIGASALMEMAVAFHNKKKIFLLHDFDKKQKYALEVALTKPTVLNNNLNLIIESVNS